MKVAILIVTWNGMTYLEPCLKSLREVEFPKSNYQVILVDNGSDDGTVEFVHSNFPEVDVISLHDNLGFAGGNNVGLRHILHEGYDYVVLLNQDTVVEPSWLKPLVEAAESDSDIGAVQSLILKYGMDQTVNSSGNLIHILGFGYCGDLGKSAASLDLKRMGSVVDIPYPMGACVLLRVDALRVVGLFDESFFAYAEDLDLAWRLRLAGYRSTMAPASIVYHHYTYQRHRHKFYWIERNRWLSMLKNYHIGSLILLSPALLLFEIFMHAYALISGWWLLKLRSAFDVIKHLPEVRRNRQQVQRLRRTPERLIIRSLTPVLSFEEQSGPLVAIGNSFLKVYWALVCRLVLW